MTKELVALRDRHMSKKHASIPQVFYNNVFMSLNTLDENPVSLFSRLQYRLCRLPSLHSATKRTGRRWSLWCSLSWRLTRRTST